MLHAYMRACEAADASADAKSFHSGYPDTAWMGIHTPFILDVTVSPGQLRQSSNNKIMQQVIKNLLADPHPATIALASYVWKKIVTLRVTRSTPRMTRRAGWSCLGSMMMMRRDQFEIQDLRGQGVRVHNLRAAHACKIKPCMVPFCDISRFAVGLTVPYSRSASLAAAAAAARSIDSAHYLEPGQ